MEFIEKLRHVQVNLADQQIDGWLLYDFRRSNSLAHTILEIPAEKKVTRRFFYWIPQHGDPIKIVPQIEPYTLDHLPGEKWIYREWKELEQLLFSLGVENRKIAMEYSPYNALPIVSKVDAGTIDLLRNTGAEIVSSANLLQRYTSVWSPEQYHSHLVAADLLDHIAARTWAYIESSLQKGISIDEYQVQQFMLQEMHAANCVTDDPPTCAVNAHSADPHYAPLLGGSLSIRSGDFILIDLWCKQSHPHAVYADISRVGVAAVQPTGKQQEIFSLVKEARDRATLFIKEHYEAHELVEGWQVDQVCRDVIQAAGYGEWFIHRTGHNLGEEVHGPGANLDNFETHDYRQLISGTGFTIEPGIYLPHEFGVRLEYDLYLDPKGQLRISGGIQEELVCLQV